MAHPFDVEIGRRVRDARLAKGLNQTELGAALGISFQQVQKYEKGGNRIGSGRLWIISKTLDLPITYFFDGLDGETSKQAADRAVEEALPLRTLRTARALDEMPEGEVKMRFFNLIRAFAKTGT